MLPFQRKLRADLHKAGGLAVVFEVNLRMLCEKHQETRKATYKNLDAYVLPAILGYFDTSLSQDDVGLLRDSVRLRNELVHARFDRVNHLLEAKYDLPEGSIVRTFSTKHADSISEAIEQAAAGQGTREVRGLKQKDAATVGWLYELGLKNGLENASLVFRDAITLTDRLLNESVAADPPE
ncbi:MAG: hypothetical protein KJO57_05595 [Deltaproteobacteria bacterium]|nr:hypothetical protein [Deltaproteobacteria bacterium]